MSQKPAEKIVLIGAGRPPSDHVPYRTKPKRYKVLMVEERERWHRRIEEAEQRQPQS